MFGLTQTQRDCLLVIQELTDKGAGISPTFAEIQREMGASSRASVHRLIDCLQQRGYVQRERSHARSLTILKRVLPLDEDVIVGTFDGSPELVAELLAAERRFGKAA